MKIVIDEMLLKLLWLIRKTRWLQFQTEYNDKKHKIELFNALKY